MALDLKAHMKTAWKLSDEDIEKVFPVLTPVAGEIEKDGLRLQDYNRSMDKLRTDQQALKDANDRLNAEMVDWAATQSAGEPITKKMRDDLAKAQGEVARLQSVITTRATELNLDPKEVIGEAAPAQPAQPVQPAIDTDKFLTREDHQRALGEFTSYLMTLPAELQQIAQEHHALTGEYLDTRTIVSEIQTRARDKGNRNSDGTVKKPIDARAIWEEQHQITDKRAAAATAAHDKEITEAEERGRQAARTEAALPMGATPGRHAPVFRKAGETRDHMVQHAQRPTNVARADRITSAATALSEGRYRNKGPGDRSNAA